MKTHITDLTLKLSRSNGMLTKVRHYVNFETLLSIYHSIFSSNLRYACQNWGQSKTVCLSKIVSLQNRPIRIIHFWPRIFPNILYLTSKILRFYDLIQFLNCSLACDQQHGLLPTIFHNYFNNKTPCGHNLRSVTYNNLTIPLKQTTKHGIPLHSSVSFIFVHVYVKFLILFFFKFILFLILFFWSFLYLI